MYLESLEVVASLPIPEVHCPIICSRNHHSVGVGSKTIDNGVVSGEVLSDKILRARTTTFKVVVPE